MTGLAAVGSSSYPVGCRYNLRNQAAVPLRNGMPGVSTAAFVEAGSALRRRPLRWHYLMPNGSESRSSG
jgi:hypothetical protein